MPPLIAERKPYLLLFVLLTINLVLMSSRVRGGARGSLLEQAILTVASPFIKSASWISQTTVGTWRSYVDLRGVRQDNERLKEDLRRLTVQVHELEEARLEALRLADLLELRATLRWPSVAARVIARRASDGDSILMLDRGSGAGLARNHPVITPRGVVGRVILAEPGVSKVQSLLDSNSGIAAMIQRTRVQGMVFGDGEIGCRMEYVGESADVEVGDVVITSGLEEIYPKGFLIGVVTSVMVGEGLTKLVRVRPEVDIRRLEEVLVLLKPEGTQGQETP